MNIGFNLYLLFVVSWFLHLTSRVTWLGDIRFDFCLIFVLLAISLTMPKTGLARVVRGEKTHTYLTLLIAYLIVSVPLVYWPGSVLRFGFLNFMKAVVFYYFSVCFIDSEAKLKRFLAVFIGCQMFRVLEPLYLHLTTGYWGSVASMGTGGWDVMDRLSGAPHDVINPNGLAFVALTAIPFLYFYARQSKVGLLLALGLIPLSLYALLLTGSRSGFLGLIVVGVGLFLKEKRKVLVIILAAVAMAAFIPMMGENQKDRYSSIVNPETRNAGTVQGRLEGIRESFQVGMHRPIFGHGVGTSREANANFGAVDQPAHNLYAELLQEIGVVGALLFLLFVWTIYTNFRRTPEALRFSSEFLVGTNRSMQVWFYMNLLFSLASYGLSGYEWYLFAGLSVVVKNLGAPAAPPPAGE